MPFRTAFLASLLCLSLSPRAMAAELLVFVREGCEWCEIWQGEVGAVYAKTDEGQAVPMRKVWTDEDRPDELTYVKGVVYTPTFVVVHDGREYGRILGYPGESFFYDFLREIMGKLPQAGL